MDPQVRVGIDVGCKAHRVGIADPKGSILEEFDISYPVPKLQGMGAASKIKFLLVIEKIRNP